MAHPNEDRLRELYAVFATGNLQGFLDGCNDDVTFNVPGRTPGSGTFTKATFFEWIGGIMAPLGGTFQEHVLDCYANDERGVLLLKHEFDRDGAHREYITSHAVELSGGRISRWEERPADIAAFERAWGTVDGSDAESVLRRIYDETINKHDLNAVDELFAEDYLDHGPMGDLAGREAFRGLLAQWLAAVPDVHCEVENITIDGDMAGWVVRTTGTHTGDGLGFPATGKSFETISANVGRLRDGKAVEHWSEQGMLPMLTQLGVLPPMGG